MAQVLAGNARAFKEIAQAGNSEIDGSRAYYLAIATELALKAYLLQCGITDNWNRIHLRHDLNKALRCARMAGLRHLPDGLPQLIATLSPLYASGALSFGQGKPVLLMTPETAEEVVGGLLSAVATAMDDNGQADT
ncbi:hypothetical protein MU852_15315 [Brevundimonas albigilva]|uniref:hypothetical protein n=1 Tax=Brevundimonas TaxID=41275 RepID=UPI00201B5F98|nr:MULTISPECIES: hypothetical protein [Brevundimonas]UQV18101.1 hypothetical protein MU852_15315 [Brevundimonas albigilva]